MSWLAWLALVVLVIAAIVAKVRRSGFIMIRHGMPGSGWPDSDAKPPGAASIPETTTERMLRCEHCGLYFPESEAVRRAGAVFCCQEHALTHFPH